MNTESLGLMITSDSLVVATRSQVSSDLDGEAVILNVDSGVYYGLDPIGARIWTLIQNPMTVEKLTEVLLAEYDVDESTCRNSLIALLERLREADLIEVSNGE